MSTHPRNQIAVVGGGLAGLSAAVQLSKYGISARLYEKRPFLGGRAFSFKDPETGIEVDNGQHVVVGAFTEYLQFLREIDATGNMRLQDRLRARVIRNGSSAWLRASSWVPGSAANLPVILGYGHLSLRGRIRLLYGLARVRLARRKPGSGLEKETFDSWLRRHRQNDETIGRFWRLIVLPALNDEITSVSADAGLMLFQTALFGSPERAGFGYPVVGLSRLAGDAAERYLTEHGGEVLKGVDIDSVWIKDGRACGVKLASSGELEPAAAVIVAVPGPALEAVLPAELRQDSFFSGASGLDTAPIVCVHIWYDRSVLPDLFVAVLDSPLQWVFNVTKMHEIERDDGDATEHIAISLSGAWDWKDRSKAELQEIFVAEMARVFPAAAEARVVRFIAVKMLEATFRVVPGSEMHRLPQRTPVDGLFLAGDWTRTGWPSTMESAVRSGTLAADATMNYLTN